MRNRSRGVWKENGANRWENVPQWSLGRTYFCNSKTYLYIKTENGYEPYHRYLWKKQYGAIPAGHVVAFKAGADKKNFELKDL